MVDGRWLGMQLRLDSYCKKKSFKTGLAQNLLDALKIRNKNLFKNPIMTAALYLDPRFRLEVTKDTERNGQAKNVLLDIWRRLVYLRYRGSD